ncbi:hypothetical protein LTR56_016594 [Elasticomyces elasticus]|nr:hypothetical protein LTR56_016594 [Elasticomyces elasticus]KAK3650625.1 hypothetical protein LTR22_012483 [Elasticomyces elasticus]KAK4913958.1 hypothetical protein LTR49_017776 [Elasticomyces elasticus]KAK5753122.1 hypothetical protein LTS12_016801 [Elasticomyces elasticus]
MSLQYQQLVTTSTSAEGTHFHRMTSTACNLAETFTSSKLSLHIIKIFRHWKRRLAEGGPNPLLPRRNIMRRRQVKHVPRVPSTKSPLLDIPAELRLIVYDHMFEQIVAPHEVSSDVYRAAPDNWPPSANEWWSTYSSLARSSKQIHKEMTHRFENIFLPRLSLHYSNIQDLRRYRKAIRQAPPAFGDTPFTIHTTITALVDTNVLIGHKHQVTEFARLYSRLDLGVTELLHDFRKEHVDQNEDSSDSDGESGSESESESTSEVAKAFVVVDEWSKCERCEIDLHAVRRGAEDKLTHFYHLPTHGNMQVVVVDQPINGKTDPSSQYLELRGRVGDLELDALEKICPEILREEERAIMGSRSKRLKRRNERKE